MDNYNCNVGMTKKYVVYADGSILSKWRKRQYVNTYIERKRNNILFYDKSIEKPREVVELMKEVFFGNEEGFEIDFKDSNKLNIHLNNLYLRKTIEKRSLKF